MNHFRNIRNGCISYKNFAYVFNMIVLSDRNIDVSSHVCFPKYRQYVNIHIDMNHWRHNAAAKTKHARCHLCAVISGQVPCMVPVRYNSSGQVMNRYVNPGEVPFQAGKTRTTESADSDTTINTQLPCVNSSRDWYTVYMLVQYIDGVTRGCGNSNALAMDLPQSYTKPSR